MKRAFKFRIYPNKTQEGRLNKTLETCKNLYNDLLETYKQTDKAITGYDLNQIIKQHYKGKKPELKEVHSQVLQNISDRINKAFSNYFRRVKEKQKGKKIKVGYPRFKKFYKNISYPQSGFELNGKLHLSKLGNIKIKQHREVKGEIKTLTIKKTQINKWFVSFSCELENKPVKHKYPENKIGID